MGTGAKIAAMALPAFILGHAALAMALTDEPRRPLWKALTIFGYGVCVSSLIVGITWMVWS